MTNENTAKQPTTQPTTIIELIDGYDRSKTPARLKFRPMTLAEVKQWAIPHAEKCSCVDGKRSVTFADLDHVQRFNQHYGTEYQVGNTAEIVCGGCEGTGTAYRDITPSHIWFRSNDGKARRCKVNGKLKTWKRDANRVELPVKYGMYEYATFTTQDIEAGRILAEV